MQYAQKDFGSFTAYADDFITRALLNLKGYDALQTLADFRLQKSAKLTAVWKSIQTQVQEQGFPLVLPEGSSFKNPTQHTGAFRQALAQSHPYNYLLTSPSLLHTQTWQTLRTLSQDLFFQDQVKLQLAEETPLPDSPEPLSDRKLHSMYRKVQRSAQYLDLLQNFLSLNGRLPRSSILGKTAEQYTEEERAEVTFAQQLMKYRKLNNVYAKQIVAIYDNRRMISIWPEEFEKFIDKHHRLPRAAIAGKTSAERTEEERAETLLRKYFDHYKDKVEFSPALQQKIQQIQEENKPSYKYRTKLESFVEKYGRLPHFDIAGKTPAQYTPEEADESILMHNLNRQKHYGDPADPNIRRILEILDQYSEQRLTLEKIDNFMRQYARPPRSNISGKHFTAYTPEEREEVSLGHALANLRANDKVGISNNRIKKTLQSYKKLKKKQRFETTERVLKELESFLAEYHRLPRLRIAGKTPAELTEAEIQETVLAQRVMFYKNAKKGHQNDPAVQKITRLYKENGITAKWLGELRAFVNKHHCLPRGNIIGKTKAEYTAKEQAEVALQKAVYRYHYRYRHSTDPNVQEILKIFDEYNTK